MKTNRLSKLQPLSLIIALLGGSALTSLASDPVGIYAYVDKVVLEPNDATPERIQIFGGFALAEGAGYEYAKAQPGYMYFKLKPGKEEICRNEWKDFKSVAGTGQIVTFGTRYGTKPTVRKAGVKPENPDVYATGWGMTKTTRTDYGPVKDLTALRQANKAESSK